MSTIVLRSVKGTPLTNGEVDANFSNLNTDKLELGQAQSAGTANGVAFLNSSKVLTTGSALTFDGTSFGVGGTPAFEKLEVYGNINARSGTVAADKYTNYGVSLTLDSAGSLPMLFQLNNAEQMRLTSTGLGIGTSSPGEKLTVFGGGPTSSTVNFSGGSAGTDNATIASDYNLVFQVDANNNIGTRVYNWRVGGKGYSDGTSLMTLDSSGNLGLGVTPSAWNSNYKAIQVKGACFFQGAANTEATISANNFIDGVGDKYIATAAATAYTQFNGQHIWKTAPSGTAGNAISFTQAMTLDASGNLTLGETSAQGYKLNVNVGGSSTTRRTNDALRLASNGSGADVNINFTDGVTNNAWIGMVGGNLYFDTGGSERARIDSSGRLLVGTTSAIGGSSARLQSDSSTNAAMLRGADSGADVLAVWNAATSGDNIFANFATEASFTSRGTISFNRAAGLTAYNTTSDHRAKDISGPVTDSGAVIDSTPVYMGKMKGATQERPMFIAHEVPAYAHTGEKDAVDADGNPVYQQMDASALVPVMWAEIQNLRQRLAAAGI